MIDDPKWNPQTPDGDQTKKEWWQSKGIIAVSCLSLLGLTACTQQQSSGGLDRTKLPIAQPFPEKVTKVLPKDVKMPKPFKVTAPKDAPNVVVVLLDDIGFAAPSTFGGPVNTPVLSKLANNGLKYNKFHTTALCAPTRAALKGGRNHHVMNFGSIPEIATGYAGNTTVLPNYAQPAAEILRLNGYNTAAFGKWHETPTRETTAAGPQNRWPTRQGFEKFYGFVGAEDNMWSPTIFDGVTVVDYKEKPDYHFSEDMTTKAIEWVREQQSIKPDNPFFIYYSAAGSHSPHHAPKKWIDKYKGKFDKGWDQVRLDTFNKQLAMGIVPKGTKLGETPDSIEKWNELSPLKKKIYARQAEVFAAYTEYTDYQVGRLVDAIDELGQLEDTLIVYVSGDNGASPEGNATGQWNWGNFLNGIAESPEEQAKYLDKWGGPETYPMMSVGWAIAFNSPFSFTKQVASDFGGTRNGTVIHWPNGIKARGEIRQQFTHVIDVVPTILEAANIPEPTEVYGIKQIPIQGTSMMYTFDDANAKERHNTQYFEMIGNRAIYHNGWFARTILSAPWEFPNKIRATVAADDGWELFDTRKDFSLSNDLASQNPEKLAELRKLFLKEAEANQVLPLDDRLLPRLDPAVAGRPTMMGDRTTLVLYDGATNLAEDAILNFKNVSCKFEAKFSARKGKKEDGVIFSQGGRFGGWSIYVEDNVPSYAYNYLGKVYSFKSKKAIPSGKESSFTVDFDYDGGGRGKGANVSIFLNGEQVGGGRIDATMAARFSIDEGSDVGKDRGTQVVQRPTSKERHSAYTGDINKITMRIYPQKMGLGSNEGSMKNDGLQVTETD